jgi:hypothetical protein
LKARINSELSTASLRPEWRCRFRHELTNEEVEIGKEKAPKIKRDLSGTETG